MVGLLHQMPQHIRSFDGFTDACNGSTKNIIKTRAYSVKCDSISWSLEQLFARKHIVNPQHTRDTISRCAAVDVIFIANSVQRKSDNNNNNISPEA